MRNQTNEKLSRAKLLLEVVHTASDQKLIEALAESTLLELGLAYRCFLHEFAALNELPGQTLASATELVDALGRQGSQVAEVDELAKNEAGRGWAYTLLAVAVASRTQPHRVSTRPDSGLINVLQVNEIDDIKLDYSHCLEVYRKLRDAIERLRNMAQEW